MKLANLRDEKGGREALAQLLATPAPPRTEYFEIVNQTAQFNLTLVLAEGYDESGGVPPAGFERDTGVTVIGTDVVPGTTQRGVIQPQIDVQVTHAKCSLHWERTIDPFDEGDLTLQDQYAPAGEFFLYCGWRASQQAGRDKRPSIAASLSTARK